MTVKESVHSCGSVEAQKERLRAAAANASERLRDAIPGEPRRLVRWSVFGSLAGMGGRSSRFKKDFADDLLRRFRWAASRLKIDSSLPDLSGEPIPPTFP